MAQTSHPKNDSGGECKAAKTVVEGVHRFTTARFSRWHVAENLHARTPFRLGKKYTEIEVPTGTSESSSAWLRGTMLQIRPQVHPLAIAVDRPAGVNVSPAFRRAW